MKRFWLHITIFLYLCGSAFAQVPPHSVDLGWNWSQGTGGAATGFKVLRSNTTGGPYALVCGTGSFPACPSSPATLNFTDAASTTNPMADGQTFYYVVRATGPGGDSPNSNEYVAVLPFLPPTSPSGLHGTPH